MKCPFCGPFPPDVPWGGAKENGRRIAQRLDKWPEAGRVKPAGPSILATKHPDVPLFYRHGSGIPGIFLQEGSLTRKMYLIFTTVANFKVGDKLARAKIRLGWIWEHFTLGKTLNQMITNFKKQARLQAGEMGQVGKALVIQAWGPEFESQHLYKSQVQPWVPVIQPFRVETGGDPWALLTTPFNQSVSSKCRGRLSFKTVICRTG